MSIKPRFAVWLLLVLILISSFLFSWEKVEPEAEAAAYSVAKKRMLDWANHYKQSWLVHKYPDTLKIQNQDVQFNQHGWVVPGSLKSPDCKRWFDLLHPEEEIMGRQYIEMESEPLENGTQCRYIFTDRRKIVVSLQGKHFSVELVN
ncbi:hypothetical protein [Vibrio sp. HN007]|uniref:hypothetical protein n=1 Tax=Vibrio iocasae TaxID=3098914 RepID=UPI0035D4B0A7